MKVWIMWVGEYENQTIHKIFVDEAKAKKYVEEYNKQAHGYFDEYSGLDSFEVEQ
jgi:hypothetical protein